MNQNRIFNLYTEQGLTLVEVVTVIAVIAILSAVVVPNIIDRLPAYRLRAAGRDLFSNLQRAKHEAIRINGECGVYFDDLNHQYQVVSGGPDGRCDGRPSGNPLVALNDDILLNQITLSNYGSRVGYGSGNALETIPGKVISEVQTVSYAYDRIRFDSKGMAREMGYVYLTNENGDAVAVGTPSLAGAIVQKRWTNRSWE